MKRLIAILLFSRVLLSNEYYVSPTGSDNNPGSLSNTFKTIQELRSKPKSIEQIKNLASSYTKLLESCFNRHASKIFIPSECNNLNEMERKRTELSNLGIQLEQGERLKL